MEKAADRLKKHRVSTLTVFFMIFCMVSAGAYGIEDMIPSSGPGLTILLLLLLPFFWSIPQGLVAAELGSAIPEEGGYYKWIQRGLGEFWGFQAGWWRTLSIYVDSTLYVVLAAGYLSSFIELNQWQLFLVKVFFILSFTVINIRGLSDVGRVAAYFSVIVIATFVLLIVLGFSNWQHNPVLPFIPPGQGLWESIGLGIAICMWMYSGYESMSTMAGEMENPQVIPKATLFSVPAIMLLYILPTIAGLAAVGRWAEWSTEGGVSFATVANLVGFPAFGIVFAIAAVVSNLSLYNTYLASGSRGFFAIADDRLAPKAFKKVHRKYGTPYLAIVSMALVNLILCQYGFGILVVIDVFLLMFAYVLIYVAAIALRLKEPNLKRPFKIPLGVKGLILLCVSPVVLAVLALFSNGILYFIGGCVGIASGPVAYLILKRSFGGLQGTGRIEKGEKRAAAAVLLVMAICLAGAFYLFCGNLREADGALASYREASREWAVGTGRHFDFYQEAWYEEFTVAGREGLVVTVYYDGALYGEAAFDQRPADAGVFAADVERALAAYAAASAPLESLVFYGGDYVYSYTGGAVPDYDEILAEVGS